jgi:hypothetical protein
VAITPVVVLHAVVLSVVHDVRSVMYHQVMPVDVVFVSVPVVVVMMMPIVDANLDLLSLGFDYKHGRCNDGSSQE